MSPLAPAAGAVLAVAALAAWNRARGAWWRGLTWPRKITFGGAVAAAGAMAGLAWVLSPLAAGAALTALAAARAASGTVRSAIRKGRQS